MELQRPDFKLLTWMAEDVAAYTEEARTLGAPLEAGETLYADIHKIYTLYRDVLTAILMYFPTLLQASSTREKCIYTEIEQCNSHM